MKRVRLPLACLEVVLRTRSWGIDIGGMVVKSGQSSSDRWFRVGPPSVAPSWSAVNHNVNSNGMQEMIFVNHGKYTGVLLLTPRSHGYMDVAVRSRNRTAEACSRCANKLGVQNGGHWHGTYGWALNTLISSLRGGPISAKKSDFPIYMVCTL